MLLATGDLEDVPFGAALCAVAVFGARAFRAGLLAEVDLEEVDLEEVDLEEVDLGGELFGTGFFVVVFGTGFFVAVFGTGFFVVVWRSAFRTDAGVTRRGMGYISAYYAYSA